MVTVDVTVASVRGAAAAEYAMSEMVTAVLAVTVVAPVSVQVWTLLGNV